MGNVSLNIELVEPSIRNWIGYKGYDFGRKEPGNEECD
jgi:hypothetical protein